MNFMPARYCQFPLCTLLANAFTRVRRFVSAAVASATHDGINCGGGFEHGISVDGTKFREMIVIRCISEVDGYLGCVLIWIKCQSGFR